MKVYIHVGYPKTATTWFQKKLFPYIQNIDYIDKQTIRKFFIHPDSLDFNSYHTRRYFEKKYKNDILLSLENFIGGTNNPTLNKYKRKEHAHRLKQVFPEADIILFIRNQFDIISSSYNQYIKDGGTYSISKYLNQCAESNDYNPLLSFYEYDKTIKLYEELFCIDQIKVFLFEDFSVNPEVFINSFCKYYRFRIDQNLIDFNIEFMSMRILLKKFSRAVNFFSRQKIHYKRYLIHIPFWFNSFYSLRQILNNCRVFGNVQNSINALGENNYRIISEFYKKSNNNLIRLYKLDRIRKYKYPL